MSQISLVAYNQVPGRAFVKIPDAPGRYFLTDICVVYVECELCKAMKGEPCFRYMQGRKKYSSGTHVVRRLDYKNLP